MSRVESSVGYEHGRGWVARVSVIDSIGAKSTVMHVCATRWGARRVKRRETRRLLRLRERGDLR